MFVWNSLSPNFTNFYRLDTAEISQTLRYTAVINRIVELQFENLHWELAIVYISDSFKNREVLVRDKFLAPTVSVLASYNFWNTAKAFQKYC